MLKFSCLLFGLTASIWLAANGTFVSKTHPKNHKKNAVGVAIKTQLDLEQNSRWGNIEKTSTWSRSGETGLEDNHFFKSNPLADLGKSGLETKKLKEMSRQVTALNQALQDDGQDKVIELDEATDTPIYQKLKSQLLRGGTLGGNSGGLEPQEPETSSELDPFSYEVWAFYPGFAGSASPNLIMDPLDMGLVNRSVLGPPDYSNFSQLAPLEKALSLGHRGSIILQVVDGYIEDREGADFAIFENPFVILDQKNQNFKVFVETALVSVSQDNSVGSYVYFDCFGEELKYKGCAGVTPVVTGQGLNIRELGGDHFDLSDIGVDRIRYVKIEDTGDNSNLGSIGAGFDLDAMAIFNGKAMYVP